MLGTFCLYKGCTAYLKARATNKSGTNVEGTVGVWELCPRWKPLVRGGRGRSPLKLTTFY